MLFFCVFIDTESRSIEAHPRRCLAPFLGLHPLSHSPSDLPLRTDHSPLITAHSFGKSLPLNLFDYPRPLNLYATIFYKKGGGEGVCFDVSSFGCAFRIPNGVTGRSGVQTLAIPPSALAATLMSLPVYVANKRLTLGLKPFSCNIYNKLGGTSSKPLPKGGTDFQTQVVKVEAVPSGKRSPSLVAQRDDRIDAHSAAGRNVGC